MIKILITGGAGNIGGSLARRLLENPEHDVTIVDNLLSGSKDKLPQSNGGNWRFIKCDVNNWQDISAVMLSTSFDYVFHYAAVVGVKRTLEDPVMVLNDISGIKNILDLAKNTGVRRIFYSSSSEVYGEPVEIPQNESTTPLNSRLPYAIVKNVGESYLRSYHQEFGLDYTIFRFFNTYGPLQSTDFVISKFLSLAKTGAPITIYGDGQQTRTFCFVDDNLEATIACLQQGYYINDTVNLGSDEEITILDLAHKVKKLTNSLSEIRHIEPLKEGDMTRRQPDTSKMKKILGRDLIDLDSGILKTYNSL